MRRDLGIRVAALADTQVAASLLGEPAIGLQALLKRHLGVMVSKKHQRADWAERPLPRDMIEYAAGDTRHLHRLVHVLEDGLRELGRLSWAREEYDRLLEHVAATAGHRCRGRPRDALQGGPEDGRPVRDRVAGGNRLA